MFFFGTKKNTFFAEVGTAVLGAQEELDDKLSILGYLLVEYYRILVIFVTPTHHRGIHDTRRNHNIVQNLLQKAEFAYSSPISSGNQTVHPSEHLLIDQN